eukprot:697463-Amphidinium_carterae.1
MAAIAAKAVIAASIELKARASIGLPVQLYSVFYHLLACLSVPGLRKFEGEEEEWLRHGLCHDCCCMQQDHLTCFQSRSLRKARELLGVASCNVQMLLLSIA